MKRILLSLALLCASVAVVTARNYTDLYRNLPIALSEPVTPVIPDRTVSLLDFGGSGDGITLNTEAFRKAISSLAKQGGGHLLVPAGIYLTGPISLKDNIDLHLERNALVLFTPEKAAFLKADGSGMVPGLSASKCKNISVTGEGILDGNGEWWRAVKRSKVSDVEWKDFLRLGGTVSEDDSLWYPFGLKHFDNAAASPQEQERLRTHLIRFTDCDRVLVSGITIQNSPKFHLVPQRCRNVIIDGVTVRCPWNAQNGDGIDLMQCSDVLVTGCRVDVGDDGICLKGGAGESGLKGGPCQRILITGNTVNHAHGGFVIGSEFSGGMFDIIVRDNTFSGTDTGLRFKSGPGRGGRCRNIFISSIFMSDIRDEAIVFETSYANQSVGETAKAARTENFLPDFSDIHISGVTCRDTRIGVAAHGLLTMIHDITLEKSIIFYSEKGTDIADPAMISFRDVNILTY